MYSFIVNKKVLIDEFNGDNLKEKMESEISMVPKFLSF